MAEETNAQAVSMVLEGDTRRLTAIEFQQLARVPAATEWFANIDNPRTRRAYQNDLTDFSSFIGLTQADEFRAVNRAHVLAWRADLEGRGLAGPPSAASSPPWPACSTICSKPTPWPAATPCTGSSVPALSQAKA